MLTILYLLKFKNISNKGVLHLNFDSAYPESSDANFMRVL